MVRKRKAATATSVPPAGPPRLRGRPRRQVEIEAQSGRGVETINNLSSIPSQSSSSLCCCWGGFGGRFLTEIATDMTIIVGKGVSQQRFECHSNFLQIRSKELNKLVAKVKNGIVCLPTTDPKPFGCLFSFLYRDTFEDRTDLNEQDLINVLKLGNQYCPSEEAKICEKLMGGKITLKNVFKFHEESKGCRLTALEEMSRKYIDNVNKSQPINDNILIEDSTFGDLSETFNVGGKTWLQFVNEFVLLRPNQNLKNITGVMTLPQKLGHGNTPFRLLLLPHLETIVLNLHNEREPRTMHELVMALPRLCWFLFFKKFEGDTEFSDLFSSRSNVEIQLSINGMKFLKLSRLEREVVICGIDDHPLMKSLDSILEEGCIHRLILGDIYPVIPKTPWHSIKELVLWGVCFFSQAEFCHFLLQIPTLQNLTSWVHIHERDAWRDSFQKVQAGLNLVKHLPSLRKLTKISVYCCEWILPPLTEMQTIILDNVVELYSDCCKWSPAIFEHFHTIFPNLEKLVVCGHEPFEDCSPSKCSKILGERTLISSVSVQAMIKILKIKPIKWIQITNLDWTANSSIIHQENLLEFLCKAELIPSHTGLFPKDFILEKASATGVWVGTDLTSCNEENEDATATSNKLSSQLYCGQLDKFVYDNFQLNTIFETLEVFRYNNKDDLHQ